MDQVWNRFRGEIYHSDICERKLCLNYGTNATIVSSFCFEGGWIEKGGGKGGREAKRDKTLVV